MLNLTVIEKNVAGGGSGIDWKPYKNLGNMVIFMQVILPNKERDIEVHLESLFCNPIKH